MKIPSSVYLSACICIFVFHSILHLAQAQDGTETRPLLDRLFPKNSLEAAYEKYPLLSKVFEAEECSSSGKDEDGAEVIPNVHLTTKDKLWYNGVRQKVQDVRLAEAQWLFQFNDLDKIFQQEVVFRMVKKITVLEGLESITELTRDQMDTVPKILDAFDDKYSLIIRMLQRHWRPVTSFTRMVEDEVHMPRVSVNLYVTPGNAEAFDTHWDPMDVIVLQLSGQKYWNVAKNATVYLSNNPLKHKPDRVELDVPYYSQFLMKPGDALYIPRGFLHNASTVGLYDTSIHVTFGIAPEFAQVADLIRDVLDPTYHPIVGELINHERDYNVLRQSVHSYRNKEDISSLVDEGLQLIESQRGHINEGLTNACNDARDKLDYTVISNFLEKVKAKCEELRAMDDSWLAAFKESLVQR